MTHDDKIKSPPTPSFYVVYTVLKLIKTPCSFTTFTTSYYQPTYLLLRICHHVLKLCGKRRQFPAIHSVDNKPL